MEFLYNEAFPMQNAALPVYLQFEVRDALSIFVLGHILRLTFTIIVATGIRKSRIHGTPPILFGSRFIRL